MKVKLIDKLIQNTQNAAFATGFAISFLLVGNGAFARRTYNCETNFHCGSLRTQGRCVLNVDGTPGGFIASTAKVSEGVYISPKAEVCDVAQIKDRVRIEGSSKVSGKAILAEDATISDQVIVMGGTIKGFAKVKGHSKITGGTIEDYAEIDISPKVTSDDSGNDSSGEIKGGVIKGFAQISGHATIFNGKISDHALIGGVATIYDGTIFGSAKIVGGMVSGKIKIFDKAIIAGGNISGDYTIFGSTHISKTADVEGKKYIHNNASIHPSVAAHWMLLSGLHPHEINSLNEETLPPLKSNRKHEILRESRQAGQAPKEFEATELHQKAKAAFINQLSAWEALKSGMVVQSSGAEKFLQRQANFLAAQKLVRQAKASIPRDKSFYHVNYDYLAFDPYSFKNSQEVEKELQQADISPTHILAVKNTLGQGLGKSLVKDLNDILERINKNTDAKRRLIRAFDKSAESQESVHQLALDLISNTERCGDGIQDGLSLIEKKLTNQKSPKSSKAELTLAEQVEAAETLSPGEFISTVLTNYKMKFVESFSKLKPKDDEFKTVGPQILYERMRDSLGLPPRNTNILAPGYGREDDEAMKPKKVMTLFLRGGVAQLKGEKEAVTFDAYDVDKMVQLLQETRERNFGKSHKKEGLSLTNKMVTDFALSDPLLADEYYKFYNISGDTPNYKSNYFETPKPGQSIEKLRLKPAFWLHLLEKTHYIR